MEKITKELVSQWIPVRDNYTYKNKLGHVLCIGGDEHKGGAIILSAAAAVYAGAGLVTVATAQGNKSALHSNLPEAMFIDFYKMNDLEIGIKKADVIVIGPGLGLTSESLEVFNKVMETVEDNQWLIIDGDAITLLSNSIKTSSIKNTVLTPHLGEWERLTKITAPANDIETNKKWRENLNAHIVLKKDCTEVYFENEVWQNTAGNPSMATGGMGDTLTGILASFLGQFHNKDKAILSAVFVHSAIADELAVRNYVTLPTQIIEYLPVFIKYLISL